MKKTPQRGKCSKERIIILQLKKLKCIVEGEMKRVLSESLHYQMDR